MSQTASHTASALSANGTSPSSSTSKFTAFLTAIGAIVLISSEIWLIAMGTVWAADGFFHLGTIGDIILLVVLVPPALWATWMTAKLAISAEMNPENAD